MISDLLSGFSNPNFRIQVTNLDLKSQFKKTIGMIRDK